MIISIQSVQSFTCELDERPYINDIPFKEDKFYWICNFEDVNVNYTCFSYIRNFNDNEIIQINPTQQEMKRIGIVEKYFESRNGIVNIYFTDKRLKAGGSYRNYVTCFDDNGTKSEYMLPVNPTIRELNWMNTRFEWTKENMSIIFAGLFLLFIIFLMYLFIKKGALRR